MKTLIRCLAVLACVVPVQAQLPIVRGRFWQNKTVQERLKLTPQQIGRMDAIYWQAREKLMELDHRVDSTQLRLEKLLNQSPIPAEAAAALDDFANSKAELEKATIGMLLRMWRELTPPQWKELRAIGQNERETASERAPIGPSRPHTPELDRTKQ